MLSLIHCILLRKYIFPIMFLAQVSYYQGCGMLDTIKTFQVGPQYIIIPVPDIDSALCVSMNGYTIKILWQTRISFDGELEDTLLGDKAGASLGGLRQTKISQTPWALKFLLYLYLQIIIIFTKIIMKWWRGSLRGFPALAFFSKI